MLALFLQGVGMLLAKSPVFFLVYILLRKCSKCCWGWRMRRDRWRWLTVLVQCPMGLGRSLQHPSAGTGLPGRGSWGAERCCCVVRCLSVTPSFAEYLFNCCGVNWIRVLSEERKH